MKVAFFELEGWEPPIIESKLSAEGFEILRMEKDPINESELEKIKDAEILSVFIYSKVTPKVIDSLPNLKLITTRSTGFDHIDVNYAKQKGILVCNVPNYGMETVAEYALLLILALLRKLKPTIDKTSRGIFDRNGLRGHDLYGKTVGVVGTGKIGAHLIKLLSPFEVEILAYDVYPKKELEEKYKVKYVSLEELLKNSDVVSLHVPYLPSTHHLINMQNIKLMKRGSFLVNTSRGSVVETEAVVWALKEGILAGAALDTFEGEEVWIKEEALILASPQEAPPELKNPQLLKTAIENFYLMSAFNNVILTPHNAYNTHEAIMRILNTTIENITLFKKKGECKFCVNC